MATPGPVEGGRGDAPEGAGEEEAGREEPRPPAGRVGVPFGVGAAFHGAELERAQQARQREEQQDRLHQHVVRLRHQRVICGIADVIRLTIILPGLT